MDVLVADAFESLEGKNILVLRSVTVQLDCLLPSSTFYFHSVSPWIWLEV